jgi:hypothetical protein
VTNLKTNSQPNTQSNLQPNPRQQRTSEIAHRLWRETAYLRANVDADITPAERVDQVRDFRRALQFDLASPVLGTIVNVEAIEIAMFEQNLQDAEILAKTEGLSLNCYYQWLRNSVIPCGEVILRSFGRTIKITHGPGAEFGEWTKEPRPEWVAPNAKREMNLILKELHGLRDDLIQWSARPRQPIIERMKSLCTRFEE